VKRSRRLIEREKVLIGAGRLTFPTWVPPCLRAKADDAAAAELQGESATEEAKEEKANAPEYDGKAAQDKEPAAEAGDESRDEDDIDRELETLLPCSSRPVADLIRV